MAVSIPQVITEDRASGALVVDGSLRFDGVNHYLKRTPSSTGNRKTWTWSGWVKRNKLGASQPFFSGVQDGNNATVVSFDSNDRIDFYNYTSGYSGRRVTSAVYRDTSSWYHIVLIWNYASTEIKIYVNGTEVTNFGTTGNPSADSIVNSTNPNYIGSDTGFNNQEASIQLSNVYFIDGQALDASYFGYTDPLTNTWRPKKAEIPGFNDGTVWSSDSTNFTNPGQGFNGNPSNYAEVSSTAAKGTFTFPKSIQVENNVTFIYSSGTSGNLFINDSSTAMQGTSLQIQTISFTGTLSSISLQSASQPVLYYFSVDGKPLIDSVTNNFGNNGFYLPFDGSAPIGEDKSGNGNNWTPVNFGGSNTIEKATGALPILNTDGGGKVARVGVRTDADYDSLVLALPLVGSANDVSNQINSGSTTKTITANGNAAASSTQSNFYGGSYYFDGTGDYLSVPTNADFGFGTGDYTIEYWYYNTQASAAETFIWDTRDGTNNQPTAYYNSSGTLNYYFNGSNRITISNAWVSGRWQHHAFVRSGTSIKAYIDGVEAGSVTGSFTHESTAKLVIGGSNAGTGVIEGYIQDFRVYKGVAKYTSNFIPASTNPDILPDTPSGVSGSSKLTKVIDGAVSFDGNGDYLTATESNSDFTLGSSGDFTIELYINASATNNCAILTNISDWNNPGNYVSRYGLTIDSNRVLWLDSNGSSVNGVNDGGVEIGRWNHYAIVRSGSTVTMYKNGISQGTVSGPDDYTGSGNLTIGKVTNLGDFNGYISNLRFVKGTALYTSDFTPPSAPLTDVTNTKLLCCQSNTSATAAAVAPGSITANGDAAATNFNPFTTDINAVRGQESGYATWNPLTNGTYSNGNLDSSNAISQIGTGTIGVSSGKWYWEVAKTDSGTTHTVVGATPKAYSTSSYLGFTSGEGFGIYFFNGNLIINGSGSGTYGAFSQGDILNVALDMDNGKVWFGKNGTWFNSGNPAAGTNALVTGLSGTYYPGVSSATGTVTCSATFGQKPFKFPPPEGFLPLNAANVRPSTVIARPDQYVGVTTYTGNGSTQSINVGLKPDFVWIKRRSAGSDHQLYDTVRGANNGLSTNLTDDEWNYGNGLTSFDSDGFTLGDLGGANRLNDTHVAWTWKAGGSGGGYSFWKDDVGYATASAAGLDGGTITPTAASVNTKSGFSIIAYTGVRPGAQTISHGLNAVPKFMIIKVRTNASTWAVYHSSLGANSYLQLNTSSSQSTPTSLFNNTVPTSSVFTVGEANTTNENDADIISYCWAEIPGFSKFGSYTHNNSVDGTFIELGFKPALILIKKYDVTGRSWVFIDSERDKFNVAKYNLWPNLTAGDTTTYDVLDILSNGFKVRTNTNGWVGESTDQYIYAAWAEAPTANLYGAQSNAR